VPSHSQHSGIHTVLIS